MSLTSTPPGASTSGMPPPAPSLPRLALIAIAVIQSLALLALYRAQEADAWPSQSPVWSYLLWTLVIAVPLMLLLALERGNARRLAGPMLAFAGLLAGLAAYVGFQATPYEAFPSHGLQQIYVISIAIACFKALMYLQQWAGRQQVSYSALFIHSWRNFLVLGLGALFVGAFYLVLQLWASLFMLIGIDVFRELFRKDWFLFPVLGLAHGIGIVIFRNLTTVIDGITRLLRGLIMLLLPLILLVAVVFLATLPFVGLDALWSTKRGTGLLLSLMAFALFFVNSVYQDGRAEAPYPMAVHRLVWICLLVLPVVAGLALYGLSLRVGQHGWSVARCWGMLVWVVLTLYAVGYAVGILRRKDDWTVTLARVNTGIGLLVLALMLLVNSPLLDFRKTAVHSQLLRVESGDIERAALDVEYFARELARPGHLALEALKEQAADDPDFLARIESALTSPAPYLQSGNVIHPIELRPADLEVPADLRAEIDALRVIGFDMGTPEGRYISPAARTFVFGVDLDQNGETDYVVVQLLEHPDIGEGGYRFHKAIHFYAEGERWQRRELGFKGPTDVAGLYDALADGDVELRPSRFRGLAIGGVELDTR